jgi:poly(A) polymerase
MSLMRDRAVEVVKVLRKAGFRAYFAGGCVRDLVMGQEPQDYDVATNARPEEVMKLFPKTIPVGVNFGVIKVLLQNDEFEVSTFRSDGQYLDGRHPVEVHFTGEKEDAARRDFTINGMFYDPVQEKVIDYIGGQRDIKAGIIRAIGSPLERFHDDKLRLMRAVRFSTRFNYTLEPQTEAAIADLAPQITQVSAERIRDELEKMLTGPNPSGSIRLLHKTGILKVILQEVAEMEGVEQPKEFHPEGDVLVHTLLMLDLMRRPVDDSPPLTFDLAMGVLLHDVGKPPTFTVRDRIRFDNHCEVGARMAHDIGQRFRMSNKQVELVVALVKDHLKFKDVKKMRESTLKRFLRQPHFQEHLELHRLDCMGSHGDLTNWEFCRQKLKELPSEKIRPVRLLTGEDLIQLGYSPGPVFKQILTTLEDAQLEGRVQTREDALKLVKEQYPCD